MQIPRMSMITLGVTDLDRATGFYEQVLATPPNKTHDGVRFIELPGVWLGLYPLDKLAEDVQPRLSATRGPFPGFTLAHNAHSEAEVRAICERARAAGATIMTEPAATFWGGFHCYFADPDGYYWEIAYGEMFDFDAHGDMRWKAAE